MDAGRFSAAGEKGPYHQWAQSMPRGARSRHETVQLELQCSL